jgi:hypothetical protein
MPDFNYVVLLQMDAFGRVVWFDFPGERILKSIFWQAVVLAVMSEQGRKPLAFEHDTAVFLTLRYSDNFSLHGGGRSGRGK